MLNCFGKHKDIFQFYLTHDYVIEWKHIPQYWPLARLPVNSPHKGQWRGALMFFICAWINTWVNSRKTCDLRRHHAHCDVIVMHLDVEMAHIIKTLIHCTTPPPPPPPPHPPPPTHTHTHTIFELRPSCDIIVTEWLQFITSESSFIRTLCP